MTAPRIGELFAGSGGLGLACRNIWPNAVHAWVSDIDPGASKILAHRFPDAPNLGDITAIDWQTVPPVDIITAGFPCQPVSTAGRRQGDQDERWLWDDITRAISALRPRHVILENVRGLLTNDRGRLFGTVVGALAGLGYDAVWCGVRAADVVGACHGRFRVFIVATDTENVGHQWGWQTRERRAGSAHRGGVGALLPTPKVSDTKGSSPGDMNRNSPDLRAVDQLLPTPAASRSGRNKSASPGAAIRPSLDTLAPLLLPTPKASNNETRQSEAFGNGRSTFHQILKDDMWGKYAAAIHRHAHFHGHPAPDPTSPNTKGRPRLNPAFVEWMMMLPPGWITDLNLTRNQQLKALGNGVIPPQATWAIRWCLQQARAAA